MLDNTKMVVKNSMKHFKIAKKISKLLDSQFSILGRRFGIEPLIGLIPWVGDTVTLFLSLYIVYAAISMKVPHKLVVQMLKNVVVDYLVGLIPIVGDVIDFLYKANDKNFKILSRYAK